jgi:hypothetical protein
MAQENSVSEIDEWYQAARREIDDALEDAAVFYRTPWAQVMQVVSMHNARMYRLLVHSQRIDDDRVDDLVVEVGMVLDLLREQANLLAASSQEAELG